MRVFPLAAAAIALGVALSLAVPAQAEDAAPSKQNATPSISNENAKGNEALRDTPSTGRTEQSATSAAGADQASDGSAKQPDGPVLVNGKLNVNGAPQDSQSVPAKFSERNDKLDHTPIMALPLGLTDAQKKLVADAVLAAHAPTVEVSAKPADELPYDVTMHELPGAASDPALGQLKFVQTANAILLVQPSNRVVVAEIAK
jgi:hypothetical protein